MNTIDFLYEKCKQQYHSECDGVWEGFGFVVRCACACHQKKKSSKDSILEPPSITNNARTSGEPYGGA